MKRSEAAKYAQWSAAVALCIAGLTAAVYLARGWQRFQDKKKAPPAPPAHVERLLSGISFSKVEGNLTIYTVEASHSTDFKNEAGSLLEDVKITVFGKNQDRNDILHTQTCRYTKSPENIDCSGPVQMDLMSAADAKVFKAKPELAALKAIHVETKAVTFERNTGIARCALQCEARTLKNRKAKTYGPRANSGHAAGVRSRCSRDAFVGACGSHDRIEPAKSWRHCD